MPDRVITAGERIMEWQRKLRSGTPVWEVYSRGESTGNFYDSEDAAKEEVNWHKDRGDRGARAVPHYLHTMELSRQRWGGFKPCPTE
jgi:hypothetical protein